MSNWQRTEQLANKHEAAGGIWLKLAGDGDRAVVIFCGEPCPREVAFVDGGYKAFTEEHSAAGLKPKLRVAINVVVLPTREVKVLEVGVAVFKDLVRIKGKYGLEAWAFEVQRHGAAKDPNTTYSILPERQLTTDEQQLTARIKLQDLPALYEGRADATPRQATTGRVATESIDDSTVAELTGALRPLPRDAVERFCQRFGVERIRQLPANLADQARAFIEVLRTESQPSPAPTSVDPFA